MALFLHNKLYKLLFYKRLSRKTYYVLERRTKQYRQMACRRHIRQSDSDPAINDVIVCGSVTGAQSHVVFFGGDVQDYPEKMCIHRDNKRYINWNLENTAVLLATKFPDSAIFVIKPNRMHLNTFSVFSSFVESNDFGVPIHGQSPMAWYHLKHVYENILTKETEGCSSAIQQENNIPIKLIGFSKGCIVLNQMLYGLSLALEVKVLKSFIDKVEELYWMDGGHCGGSNTWVCDSKTLLGFSKLNARIFVHVTPYQVNDPMREWVGREQRKFVSKLRKLGANVSDTLHFKDEPGSIETHFSILEVL